MTTVYPVIPKLAVRDSLDEEDLSDVEDEVFIRDGRNGALRLDEDGVKRPLMAPRRKCKKLNAFESHKFPCKVYFIPFCYGLTALTVLIGLLILCIFTASIFPMPLSILRNWLTQKLNNTQKEVDIIVPCTSLNSKIIWTRSLPKFTSEAPLRSNDVNADGIKDIIVGFSTGIDTVDTPEYFCNIYFNGQVPCLGGVLALNGKTGETIWTHWTTHAIFSIDCDLDITNDKVNDCVISGRGGILHSINGKDGSSIWEFPSQDLLTSELQRVLDVFDAKFIADLNGDGFGDIIASHTTQSNGIQSSEILLISGKDGMTLQNVNLPETEQLFTTPQIIVHPDGENIIVLATSSQQNSGGLYIASQTSIMYGELKLKKLQHNNGKGVFLPPILADITSDGTEDIISALFNSTIVAYDGLTFKLIWNYTVPNSEIISIPIPGYYNDDDIPDFMVKHQIGSGFPTYFYTVATILDGKTGKPLLERPIEDSLSTQMSGLSITVDGYGNDWFLHWSANCLKYEGNKDEYQFLKGQNLISQTRADLCKLRFNSTLVTRFLALSQHVGPPGLSLYYSEDWKALEYNNSINPRKEAEEKYLDAYSNSNLAANGPFVSERSPRIYKNNHKEAFRQAGNNEFTEIKQTNKLENDNLNSRYNMNPNKDKSWNNEDKWAGENRQPEKDYDILYDLNSNINPVDESGLDYVEPNEIREQRSSINHDNSEHNNLQVKILRNNGIRYTTDQKYNELYDKEVSMDEKPNISMLSDQIGMVSSNYNKTYINNNIILNDSNSETVKNYSKHQTKKFKKAVEKYGLNPKNYSDINEENEKDDSIEKIFIKESLKNVEKNSRIQSKDKQKDGWNDKVKLRKKRIKRKIEITNDWGGKIDGLPRQSPTGVLLPPLTETKGKTAVDLVFSTFWLPPSEISVILIKEDLDCIQKKKTHLESNVQYSDDENIVKECLKERGININAYQEAMDRENVKIALGQMTIYRMRIECACPEDMLPNQSCKNISSVQSWPEHLGVFGNGYFKPMHNP